MSQGQGEPTEQELDQFLEQFGAELGAVEQELSQVRDRYDQVVGDRLKRQTLGSQIEVVRPQRDRAKTQAQRQKLAAKLKALEQQVSELDVALESRLFAESGFDEVFWQAVRFGGLGIAIGWLLERWVG